MPEYTPTTAFVRKAYTINQGPKGRTGPEFDRWLAEVEGAAAARAWDEGESAGQHNAGDGFAALLSGLEAPKPKTNPYRAAEIRERKSE